MENKPFNAYNPVFCHLTRTHNNIIAHYHTSYELYYTLDGSTRMFVGDEIFTAATGSFIFIPKGMFHHADSEKNTNNEHIVISFDDDLFNEENKIYLSELLKQRIMYVPKHKLPKLEEVMYRIERESDGITDPSNPIIRLYILELIIRLCQYKERNNSLAAQKDSEIDRVAEYISANYGEDLSLAVLGKRFGMSISYLSRKFKKDMGIGIVDYITYVRVLNGERLLKESDLSVTEIAERCGYNDSNYFSTTFKRLRGVTPLKYRTMERTSIIDY